MCGLTGFIQFKGQDKLGIKQLCKMNDAIEHRGPDGEGYFLGGSTTWIKEQKNAFANLSNRTAPVFQELLGTAPNIGLAHRRLSIIDLSEKASQPMTVRENDLWIVFNGEIYNHQEIREELKNIGADFLTDHSDTEVILQAYKMWGIEAIHRFRGMFAIVLVDMRTQKIYFVRDRIGVKPLYYSWNENTLLFGSEIKALLKSLPSLPNLCRQSVYDYMTFLTVPAPHTMYEGILKLPAGHWMELDFAGNYKLREYWDPLDGIEKNRANSSADWQKSILDDLKTSVRYRMVSDVPVGVFLSGGIDSSANAVLFSEQAKNTKVKTFTVGYSGSITHKNEFPYAKKMADLIHSDHHERTIEQSELLEFLPKMAFHQDEPLADPVCIPLYFISKLARENGVTVCQVGEGSDELFIGYSDWITKYKLQKFGNLPIPNFFKKSVHGALEGMHLSTSTAREFLRRDSRSLPVFWSGAEAFTEVEKNQLFRSDFVKENKLKKPDEYIRSLHDQFLQRAPENSICDWMSYADLKLRLPELLLMRVDKMTMACGLEARVPFLDHRFVQMAFQIPEDIKIKGMECKGILKKSVEAILPKEIIYRKKQGFSAPVTEWLSDALGGVVESSIWDFQRETNMFNEEALHHFLRIKHRGVWNLFNLAIWWKNRGLEKV